MQMEKKYNFISCLNDDSSFIDLLEDIVLTKEQEF